MAFNRFQLIQTEIGLLLNAVSDESAHDAYEVALTIIRAYELHEPEEITILRLLIKMECQENERLREEVAQERKARKQAERNVSRLQEQLYHSCTPKAIGS